MTKTYIGGEKKVTAKPRSRRLRDTGTSVTTSTTIVTNNSTSSTTTVTDANSHTHANKADIDKLGVADGYVTITEKSEAAEGSDETALTTTSTAKTKAGYADEAGSISDDSALWAKLKALFLSKTGDDTAAGQITFSKGLKILTHEIDALTTSADELSESDSAVMSAKRALKQFLRTDAEGTAAEFITFLKGAKFGSYTSESGGIIQVDSDGKTYAEVDKLKVRMKAYFETLEIIHEQSVAGKWLITPGGSTRCTKVEATTDGYKCYFMNDQDGVRTDNQFAVGDLVISKDFNITPGIYENVKNHYWWRAVTGKGADWIELSKTDCDSGSDVPQAGDVMCHLGSKTDRSRQNALIFSAVDEYSPCVYLYTDIDSYTLAERDCISYGVDQSTNEAFMHVFGNCYIGDKELKTYMKFTSWGGLEICASKLSIKLQDGSTGSVPADRGAWSKETQYYYYDRVSHGGGLWLLDKIKESETSTGDEPTAASTKWSQQVKKGEDGKNSVRIDLDNENDSVTALADGTVTSQAMPTTTAYLWDGATKKSVSDLTGSTLTPSGCTLKKTGDTNYTVTNDGGMKITLATMDADKATVTVTFTYGGNDYTAIFSITKLKGMDKYEIITTPTAVTYNADTAAYSPSSIDVSIYRTRGNGTREKLSELPGGYALKYAVDGGEGTAATYAGGAASVAVSGEVNIAVTLYDAAGNVLDSETVPTVKDGKKGADGTAGTKGTDGITLQLSPGQLMFNTDAAGKVLADDLANKTCSVTCAGGTTAPSLTLGATDGCTAEASGNVIRIKSVKEQTVSGRSISVGSGWVDFDADCGGVSVSGRLTFTVSINVLWAKITANDAKYEQQYSNLNNDIGTLQTDVSTMSQTAEQISLKVDRQSVNRNLLKGSGFRSASEVTWNTNYPCEIVRNGYGGENAVYINAAATSYIFKGVFFSATAVTAGKTYTMSIMVKSPDVAGIAVPGGCEVKFYNPSETEVSSRASMDLTPSADDEWELKTLTFTVPDGATYLTVSLYVISSGELYICRPMIEEGDEYTGWSLSAADSDVLLATGIDILNGKITATADNFVVQANDSTEIAVFGIDANGRPYLNASLISADVMTANVMAQPFESYASKDGFITSKSMSWIVNDKTSINDMFLGFDSNGVTINIYNNTRTQLSPMMNIAYADCSNGFGQMTVHIPAYTMLRALTVKKTVTVSGSTYTVCFLYLLVRHIISGTDLSNCYITSNNDA